MAEADTHQFGNIVLAGKNSHREENVGVLKMNTGGFFWKSKKTGVVHPVSKSELRAVEWMKIPHACQIKVKAKGGFQYTFAGLRGADKKTIESFCLANFDLKVENVPLSWRGWNFGELAVEGTNLNFKVEEEQAFEIPLNDIMQATAQKNDAVLEMADDDTALPDDEMVVEIRVHVPAATGDDADNDSEATPAQSLVAEIKSHGDFMEQTGQALASLEDIPVQVPRGRYDIEMFEKYMKLHGKTYDYKVLYSNVSGLYVLPKPGTHMALCISLEHPLRQGATMYPHVVLQLIKEATIEVTLKMDEDEVSNRFGGKLEQEEQGEMTDVIAKVISAFTKRKVQTIKAGGFNADKDDNRKSIRCSMKAVDGLLYPLDKCFFFIASKPVLLEFDRISSIEFNRVDKEVSAARTFDLTLHMKDGSGTHQFVNLQRGDYRELFNFLTNKKIRIKNISTASQVDFGNSGDEDDGEDDPYRARVRASRPPDDDDEDDDSEEDDEDFAPKEESDIDEEYDEGDAIDDERAGKSKAEESDDDDEDKQRPKPAVKKQKREARDDEAGPTSPKLKKTAAPKDKGSKVDGKKKKPAKDKNAPKKNANAYMLWFNGNREQIKAEHPELKAIELGKIGGEQWRAMNAAAKAPWDDMAKKDKERYEREMAAYKQSQSSLGIPQDDDSD
eukprot:CAMPEP_0119308936 /NCGR_PEP_ID=MMETSP1333-20130426/12961_1 /TAXON_ID=418940 /ORGANISM="Scyphosphaera apsteinii, Strain RCC1455" /LENGTH=671 /DNA_ID=CAMNT_0007312817 /DNA_START=30 /DNA_END=2045 /DNA_ORIENTATION=+